MYFCPEIPPQTIKECRHPRQKVDLLISNPLLADGFRFAIFPWVARSKNLLRFYMVFVRNRLPMVNQIYPSWGIESSRMLKRFRNFGLRHKISKVGAR